MEKDIDRIKKNNDTDIVIRIDDFGGKVGLTIREFVKSERYTGFTKAGTRIPAEQFKNFKAAINLIDEKDLESSGEAVDRAKGEEVKVADDAGVAKEGVVKEEKKSKKGKAKVDIKETEM